MKQTRKSPTIQEIYTERMGGEKWVKELQEMRKEYVKVDRFYYEKVIEKLKSMLELY